VQDTGCPNRQQTYSAAASACKVGLEGFVSRISESREISGIVIISKKDISIVIAAIKKMLLSPD
jgi:hypothetical protein